MNRSINIFLTILILIIGGVVMTTSCTDDIIYANDIRPGDTRIGMTVDYRAFDAGLESRASGTSIKGITSLWIVVYDKHGKWITTENVTSKSTIEDDVSQSRPDQGQPDEGNPGNISQSEEKTSRATFSHDLPNGVYRIYAVANHDMSGFSGTETELRNIQLTWESDVTKNSEMFGYFSESKDQASDVGTTDGIDATTKLPVQRQAPEVTLNGGVMNLYAWIRRAASKLTIVYDGSSLNDDVIIYIKSAVIKDIPKTCLLGETNHPTKATDLTDSEKLIYYDQSKGEPKKEADFPSGYLMKVSSGVGVCGAVSKDSEGNTITHSDSDEAIFFYENCQGKGEEGTITDKRQDVSGSNSSVSYPNGGTSTGEGWKDGKLYGSYVEVSAYYSSLHDGKGEIIYRFMLGKDHITDYNAERNYHYKLTMKFNKRANDVDFHIDYTLPKPSHHYPETYYISYLYNQKMEFPYVVAAQKKVRKVVFEIEENPWWPEKEKADEDEKTNKIEIYVNDAATKDYNYGGFLSLREVRRRYITGNNNDNNARNTQLKNDYTNNMRHIRTYDLTKDKVMANPNPNDRAKLYKSTDLTNSFNFDTDTYRVTEDLENGDGIMTRIAIPMFTRGKQLIKQIAYSGNNPYIGYRRIAKVKIKTWLVGNNNESKPDLTGETKIVQIRRVVNPKGVYRTGGNTEPFHVQLKAIEGDHSEKYEDISSELGGWKAYIYRGQGRGFSVTKSKGGAAMDTVFGGNGSKIQFWINFPAADGNAIVKVEYHNYSCHHLIFLRQGKEPQALVPGGAKWHYSNVRWADGTTTLQETDDARDEGSLYRFGNIKEGIDATSNIHATEKWYKLTVPVGNETGSFVNPANENLNISAKDYGTTMSTKKFTEIDFTKNATANWPINGVPNYTHIVNMNDFKALYDGENIEQGYGVLYGDGATETATNVSDIYGYIWNDTQKKTKGMRGLFVYNDSESGEYSGRSIFLPIGVSGMAHRKKWHSMAYGEGNMEISKWEGVLKYTGRNGLMATSTAKLMPLFYDLWRKHGAVYWMRNSVKFDEIKTDKLYLQGVAGGNPLADSRGFDINYFSFDFFPISESNIFEKEKFKTDGTLESPWSSAGCFVRLVDNP